MLVDSKILMKKNCPSCSKTFNYILGNAFNPFCSERCKLLDLGAWASEKFIIKGKENDTSSENET